MSDTPLRAALAKLLSQGEKAADNRMLKTHAAKNAPPAESCPECKVPLVEGKCAKCGYEVAAGEDESELAATLEQGAEA